MLIQICLLRIQHIKDLLQVLLVLAHVDYLLVDDGDFAAADVPACFLVRTLLLHGVHVLLDRGEIVQHIRQVILGRGQLEGRLLHRLLVGELQLLQALVVFVGGVYLGLNFRVPGDILLLF